MAIEERTAAPEQSMQSARNTLQETIVELKKTTWPSREEGWRLTFVVIGVIVVLGLYMGLLDVILSHVDKFFKLT